MRVPPRASSVAHPTSPAPLLAGVLAIGLAVAMTAVPTGSAHAAPAPAPLPADYSADAHGDIVALRADVLGGSLAAVTVAHAQASTSSTATPRTKASSANLDVALGGSDTPLDDEAVSAASSSDPPAVTLVDVPLAPVADTDRDGLRDKVEVTGSANRRHGHRKTDPANYDTDLGGTSDGREVREGSDPTSFASYPSNPRSSATDGRT